MIFTPPRGSTIPQQQNRRENRHPLSRNAELASRSAAPPPLLRDAFHLPTGSPKTFNHQTPFAAVARTAGTTEQ